MGIREAQRKSAERFLHPGEIIEATFSAQTKSNLLIALGVVPFVILNRYRMIVATSERILVLDSGQITMSSAYGIVTELPRSTLFGQPSGLWHQMTLPGLPMMRVHKRFHKDMIAADAAYQRHR